MGNLFLENSEARGALKLLELLERDWAMKMTPKAPCTYYTDLGDFNKKDLIPVDGYRRTGSKSTKKLFTDALVRWLHDTGHMMRYLQGDVGEFEVVKVNKDLKPGLYIIGGRKVVVK